MGLDVTGQYRYPPPNPAWLAQSREPVVLPELAIVDPHHHLWEESGHPYLLDDLVADLESGHRVLATVFVQAHYGYRSDGPAHLAPVGETEKVAAMAAEAHRRGIETKVAAGIVAFADLTLGDGVDEVLQAHFQASDGRLRGIRHSVSRDPLFPNGIVLRPAREGLLSDPAYLAGLKRVEKSGLIYEAMLYHRQIPELTALARSMPDLTIVLDHIGCIIGVGPYEGRERETLELWRTDMAELATCPNVRVKIGGFGMVVCGPRWNLQLAPPTSTELQVAWRPYVETCIELFGARRCMFESNFPVDKAMYPYRTVWNAFKLLCRDASLEEQRELLAETAIRTYRLDVLPEAQ